MSEVDSALIQRITRLTAVKADRGYSEAEVSFAAQQVQRLMAEHNISLAVLEATGKATPEGGQRVKNEVKRRQSYAWQRRLMTHVAKLNYCKVIEQYKHHHHTRSFDGYLLIGRKDNVVSTQVMFDYLLSAIERLAREYASDPSQYFTRRTHSFREGCSDRLSDRLESEYDRLREESRLKREEEDKRRQHPGYASTGVPMIIINDVIQRENDLNNDLHCGWEAGTTAKNRADNEAASLRRRAAADQREKEALERGLNEEEAWYVKIGYSDEDAIRLAAREESPAKPETDAQRRKRERREENEYWRQRERQAREQNRLDRSAYSDGASAGTDISLNRQTTDDKRHRIGTTEK